MSGGTLAYAAGEEVIALDTATSNERTTRRLQFDSGLSNAPTALKSVPGSSQYLHVSGGTLAPTKRWPDGLFCLRRRDLKEISRVQESDTAPFEIIIAAGHLFTLTVYIPPGTSETAPLDTNVPLEAYEPG